jgi:hypothetical protein
VLLLRSSEAQAAAQAASLARRNEAIEYAQQNQDPALPAAAQMMLQQMLVEAFSSDSSNSPKQATLALRDLAFLHAPNQAVIASAGAIPRLVLLLGSSSQDAQEAAAGALHNLAANHSRNVATIIEEGAIQALVLLLAMDAASDTGVQGAAARALCALAGVLYCGSGLLGHLKRCAVVCVCVCVLEKVVLCEGGAAEPKSTIHTGSSTICYDPPHVPKHVSAWSFISTRRAQFPAAAAAADPPPPGS